MSTVQNVTGTSTKSASSTSAAQSTQDRFLQLLVAQMQNQDPLNPLDNAQVTSQLAQLSTVTGIEKLNATLNSMSTAFAASQSLQAASMIGRSVMAPGSKLELQDGASVGGFELAQSVDKAVVTIKDAAGNVLHSVDMGAQKAGIVSFQWDGMTDGGAAAQNGTYVFEVSAVQGGQKVTANALSLAAVGSVTLGTNGLTTLNTYPLGAVDFSSVKQIF